MKDNYIYEYFMLIAKYSRQIEELREQVTAKTIDILLDNAETVDDLNKLLHYTEATVERVHFDKEVDLFSSRYYTEVRDVVEKKIKQSKIN